MRFFWTFFWAFLLTQMLNYVVSSMNGLSFHFMTGLVLSVVITVLLFVMTLIIPNDPVEDHH
ncbi:YjzD family protein [Rossellomorea aquimaris]|uniref:YjzD family protein n=1 Tax=Rossellomorea aquimaris TaxID=189382 RepID=UPI0008FC2EB8|nr:YjzD family protein [Rossellomorea aquimaris]